MLTVIQTLLDRFFQVWITLYYYVYYQLLLVVFAKARIITTIAHNLSHSAFV